MLAGIIAVLIAGSWVGNILYYRSGQLQEPLFMNHEIVTASKGGMVDLFYFAKQERRKKSDGHPNRIAADAPV